jgi:fumarate hydratase class I
MTDFNFTELLPLSKDKTPYRLLTRDHVTELKAGSLSLLKVEPEALALLTREAMRDIAHLFRPSHLAQLRLILDDPQASPNDRFVALELIKNANISSGFVLPSCQDTGTAIKGAARADFYWGFGDAAGAQAGRMKQAGQMWVLWPKQAGAPSAR